MPQCLFCHVVLDDATKPEHVLLDALGGRKTVTSSICSGCNNKFGSTIDKALAEQVAPIRNLLRLKSGSGDLPPALKKVQAGAHKINITGDGRLELADKPFIVEKLDNDRWNLSIKVSSEDELNRFLPHIAAQLRISEESLRAQLANAEMLMISERPGAIGQELGLGGPDAVRSMVKASLVLWSTLVGNDEIRGAPYDAARRFVQDGDEQFNLMRTRLELAIVRE